MHVIIDAISVQRNVKRSVPCVYFSSSSSCSRLLFSFFSQFEADPMEVNGAWWESAAQPSATKAIIAGFFKTNGSDWRLGSDRCSPHAARPPSPPQVRHSRRFNNTIHCPRLNCSIIYRECGTNSETNELFKHYQGPFSSSLQYVGLHGYLKSFVFTF